MTKGGRDWLLSLYNPLTLQIGYRWILWRVFSAATGGQTFHYVVRIGIEEKRDRIAGFIAGIIVGKVLDADEKIIRPLLEQLAGIDDKCVFIYRCMNPALTIFTEDHQSGTILCQQGEKSSIDMRRNEARKCFICFIRQMNEPALLHLKKLFDVGSRGFAFQHLRW